MRRGDSDSRGSRDGLPEVLDKAARSLDRLEKRALGKPRILALLLERDRSVGDLVAVVYNKRYDQEGFRRLYMRVSRRLKSLQAEGMVSRALFGKEKRYAITHRGRKALSDSIAHRGLVSARAGLEPVWSRSRTVLVVSMFLVLFLFFALDSPAGLHMVLGYAFFLLLGVGITVAVYALREVL